MDEMTNRSLDFRWQHQIALWVVDFSLPKYRIAIEADGDYWHASVDQKEKDARKDHWLAAHKWTVFRFTGKAIKQSPSDCIDEVLRNITIQV